MSELTIRVLNREVKVKAGTTGAAVLLELPPLEQKPVAVLLNHNLLSLHTRIEVPGELTPVFLDSSVGHKVYRKSLCFMLEWAARKVLPGVNLHIGPSMGEGYFFFPGNGHKLTAEDCLLLKKEIAMLVQTNKPILPVKISYAQALDQFADPVEEETLLLILQKNEPVVHCVRCGDYWDLEHFPLVPETGILEIFDVVHYKDGCLLHFPEKKWPLLLSDYEEKPILYNIYTEYKRWGEILGIPSIPRLNQVAQTKEIGHFIQVSETLQEKKLSQLADRIHERRDRLKVVLVAGPSSSGKTTFTKKLAIHLQVLGFRPRLISLDDYFVSREDTPKDDKGNYDFEALSALDIELLNRQLLDLLAGHEVEIPSFDFKIGHRKESGHKMRMEDRDILMMEGIHGLNDDLTPLLPRETKFKVYISALTPLNLDNHNRISTTDNRLIRRMVRDYQFRGYTALHTLKMWPSVRRGEDKNIFPFQESADAVFNSALDYELAVLKNMAVPLLRTVPPSESEYTQAGFLISFLDNFTPISPLHVPSFSLLREFIGNSGFKY